MLQINCIGNVGRSAENVTINGNEYLVFDLAINQKIKGENITLWLNCQMLGKNERLGECLKAGAYIYVTGQAQISAYMAQKKDTQEKKPSPSVTLYVDRVKLITSKND